MDSTYTEYHIRCGRVKWLPIWDRDRPWDMRTTGSTGVPVATGLRSQVSGIPVSGTGDGRQGTGHPMGGG